MATKKSAPKIEDAKEIEVLYLGVGAGLDGKHRDRWFYLGEYPEELLFTPVANDGRALKDGSGARYDPKREWSFGKFPPPPGCRPGTIVKAKAILRPDGSTSIWAKPVEIVGVWANEKDVEQWNAKLWHDRSFIRSQGEKRKEAQRQLHLEKLDTFRTIYAKLPPTEQPYFLANVISYITRGTKALREED